MEPQTGQSRVTKVNASASDRCTDGLVPGARAGRGAAIDEFACREWSDGELTSAVVADRHGEAYAEVFRRHSASVAAAVRMILGNGPACDDIVADVFIEYWVSPTSFDPARGSLLSFLRLRARGRSIDLLRSETSRRRREIGDLCAPRASEPNIDSALLASEVTGALHNALALLPAAEREALQLAFFDGMTYRAVALRLGVAEGTVKSRIRRGLRRLRLASEVRTPFAADAPLRPQGYESLATSLDLGDRLGPT